MVMLMWLSFITFTISWGSFLKMLLAIEMMVIILFISMLFYQMEVVILLYFMIISIMSAIIGLTLLMINIRTFGTDMTVNFTF